MISFNRFLSLSARPVSAIVDSLHFHIGKRRDLEILAGKLSDEQFTALNLQGQELEKVNNARKKVIDKKTERPLRELKKPENLKVIETAWGKDLKEGNAAVVIVKSYGGLARLPLDNKILEAIDNVKKDFPGSTVETLVNEKYATIFLKPAIVTAPSETSSFAKAKATVTTDNSGKTDA